MSACSSMFNNAQTKVQSQILVGVQFFFSAAVVGLTNRPSVRLSNAGARAPLGWPGIPQGYPCYSLYLGHVPKLSDLLPPRYFKTTPLSRERTIHGIYCEWHNASIRLASRIFGDLQRCGTHSWDQERKKISL